MHWLQMQSWSPYFVGAAMGVLSWFTFLLSDKFLSCSTTYSRLSGMLERHLRDARVEEKLYYRKTPLIVDWQFMFVIGILIGAFLSAFLSQSLHLEMVPELWRQHFGDTPVLRFLVAFAGGVLMGIGARWADGCTSGHAISGALQLAISSWIAVVCLFATGVLVAWLLY
ncbi:YeeE/YedE thiosulfate transporter family protein [Halochromatium sp.]